MSSKENSDSINDFDELMEFIASERVCCNINPIVYIFNHRACQDCFRKIRKAITKIAVDWDIDTVQGMITWKIE